MAQILLRVSCDNRHPHLSIVPDSENFQIPKHSWPVCFRQSEAPVAISLEGWPRLRRAHPSHSQSDTVGFPPTCQEVFVPPAELPDKEVGSDLWAILCLVILVLKCWMGQTQVSPLPGGGIFMFFKGLPFSPLCLHPLPSVLPSFSPTSVLPNSHIRITYKLTQAFRLGCWGREIRPPPSK